jgi:DNA adenine methylase
MESRCKPILKWAGGKRQLLSHMTQHLPLHFMKYYEPFMGGCAMLIELNSMNKINEAIISDTNETLVSLYNIIKNEPSDLIKKLENINFKNNSDDYYNARDLFNSTNHKIEKAALMIYLNKHSYNGLYRVNSRNKYNVPFGRYHNPRMPSPVDILKLSKLFNKCSILNSDFEEVVKNASSGDFVFFDPPYVPLSKTSSFTSYTEEKFGLEDQERLSRVFQELTNRGVFVMESNSNTEYIKTLYKDFSLKEVSVSRNINSVSNKRTGIKELIITNYESNINTKII